MSFDKFNRENLSVWAEALAEDRTFQFNNNTRCVIASFLKEFCGLLWVHCFSQSFYSKQTDLILFNWFQQEFSDSLPVDGMVNKKQIIEILKNL